MKKTLIALAAAGALTAAVAVPASATSLVDGSPFPAVNGVTWGNFYENAFVIGDANTGTKDDAWDNIGYFQWYKEDGDQWSDYVRCYHADRTEDPNHPGDILLTCDPENDILSGLKSQVAGRVYAEGDMLRLEYTLTNTSTATINVSWYAENYYGEGTMVDTPGMDLERGYDIQNSAYGYDEGISFGLPDAAQSPNDLGVIEADNDYINVWGPEQYQALAPGKSETIVLFYFHDMDGSTNPYPSADYADLSTWAADTFTSWTNERLSRGIASDVYVANWMTEAPATGGGLASTGADITGALALGGAAFAAGAIAIIVRRRRTV